MIGHNECCCYMICDSIDMTFDSPHFTEFDLAPDFHDS